MTDLTTFSRSEAWALRRLVDGGIHDFEAQVHNNPRMLDHIADGHMSLDDYREMHSGIAHKLQEHENDGFDCRLFNRDETMFIAHLAQEGNDSSLSNTSYVHEDTRNWYATLIEKAEAMNQDRRSTDATTAPDRAASAHTEPMYNRATLAAAGHQLETGDWDAHRKLAQIAVKSGYAAEVTQEYCNETDTDTPLEHKIEILDPGEAAPCKEPGLRLEEETVLGSTITVEQFTPETPHGFFGPVTPLEDAPTDPEGPGNPVASDAHLSALSAQPPHPQAHSTGPSLT
ncbi:hypothetical protein [Brevibacterium sp. SMBL_HHYL_HB1]|jgi:hypothetical protein|uniref:hypothetical protein n=1 Tax=Brevibacterium sp. SMBL_HHYL_HB1 TaxID=2777556 RepID=UPI001BAD8281|nr:hypothetical protein [Brevibacterium sp. SMBL_HHYL_HB1]QUL78023.1 hypothetical protein IG171_11070 [Brevibacterium sp. SMBL_HHYL_HB1]